MYEHQPVPDWVAAGISGGVCVNHLWPVVAGGGGMTKEEALKLALEALESYKNFIEDAHIIEGQWHWIDGADQAITAIKQALAAQPAPPECQTEAEKTAFAFGWWKALESVRQPAVPLTDENIEQVFKEHAGYGGDDFISFARAIEAKLKEKNT